MADQGLERELPVPAHGDHTETAIATTAAEASAPSGISGAPRRLAGPVRMLRSERHGYPRWLAARAAIVGSPLAGARARFHRGAGRMTGRLAGARPGIDLQGALPPISRAI